MKKILISLVLLVSASAVMAQLNLGPKIGYTASELTTDGGQIKEEMKNTLHFGAFARLGTKTYLQPELLFMTKGTKFGYTLNGGAKQDVKLNTIDIPVLLGFKLINLKVVNIRAMAGPVGSFVINKDLENVGEIDDELKGNNIKDANWGLQAGVGADFLSLTLDIRYEFGLTNMFKGETPADFNTDDIRNNVFMVTLGWKVL